MTGVALVEAVYARARTGDWAAVEQLLSPDLVIHEPPSLPFGGAWTGRDALQRLFARVMGTWDNPGVAIDAIVGDERHVVALLRFTMTSRVTGRTFTQNVAEVSLVEDGLIREMRIHYFDAAEVAREAGSARGP
jgi:ketosteroid isomerase-like protein